MSASDEAVRRQARLEEDRARRLEDRFLEVDLEALAEVRRITDMSQVTPDQAAWLIGLLAAALSRRVGVPPPPLDGGSGRQADELEAERARPVPRPDRVVAVDRRNLADLYAWLRSGARTQAMSTDAFAAALRIARAAGIEFP